MEHNVAGNFLAAFLKKCRSRLPVPPVNDKLAINRYTARPRREHARPVQAGLQRCKTSRQAQGKRRWINHSAANRAKEKGLHILHRICVDNRTRQVA